MTWLRIEDGFCDHPKIIGLTARAFRAHVEALCYCAKHLTDGVIPKPAQKWNKTLAKQLENAGLWAYDLEGNIVIHDYLEWNPSKASVQAKRAADAKRKSERNPSGIQQESKRNLLGIRASRPVPKETTDVVSRKREPDPIWDALVDIFGRVEPGTWAHGKRNSAVKQLRLCGATAESVKSAHYRYGKVFSDVPSTDVALAKHYPQLIAGTFHANGATPAPPCPECEVGGGMHAEGCGRA